MHRFHRNVFAILIQRLSTSKAQLLSRSFVAWRSKTVLHNHGETLNDCEMFAPFARSLGTLGKHTLQLTRQRQPVQSSFVNNTTTTTTTSTGWPVNRLQSHLLAWTDAQHMIRSSRRASVIASTLTLKLPSIFAIISNIRTLYTN